MRRITLTYQDRCRSNPFIYRTFGMVMPGRQYNSGNYRYGFNGKENDQETGFQDYGMRIYDSRLSKFLSVDPLSDTYPWNSTYAFAENGPIEAIDLDGSEKYKVRLSDKNGKTWLLLNDESKWDQGLLQYEGEEEIYDEFQRPEEEQAAINLDKEIKNNNPRSVGITFKYKLKILFKKNSSDFVEKSSADKEISWLSTRLKNIKGLNVKLKANLGWTDKKTGKSIPPKSLDESARIDGKVATNREATKKRGEKVKGALKDKGVDQSKVQVQEGKSLSGEENRNVEIEFERK